MTIKTFTSVETFSKFKTLLFDSRFLTSSSDELVIHSITNNIMKTHAIIGQMAIGMAEFIYSINIDEIDDERIQLRIKSYIDRMSSISPSQTGEVKELLTDFFIEFEELSEDAMRFACEFPIVYIARKGEDVDAEDLKKELYLNSYKAYSRMIEQNIPKDDYDRFVYKTDVGLFPNGKPYIFINDFLKLKTDEEKVEICKFMATIDDDISIDTFSVQKFEKRSSNKVEPRNNSFILSYMKSEMDTRYDMYEEQHGDTLEQGLKTYDLNNYDPTKTLLRKVVDKETNKGIQYDITIHTISEFEELAIELRRLYKRDYPESIGMLETYLYSMNVEQLRDMLKKLS